LFGKRVLPFAFAPADFLAARFRRYLFTPMRVSILYLSILGKHRISRSPLSPAIVSPLYLTGISNQVL
jgi:hypothetical protein